MTESFGIIRSGDTIGTVVSAGNPQNTVGSWTTIGTATANFKAIELLISGVQYAANCLFAVRIGGSTVAVEGIHFVAQPSTLFTDAKYYIPFGGLNGDTIEIQSRASVALTDIKFTGNFLTNEPFTPLNISSSYGFDTATSLGTEIDPGGTANTEGTLVELTTSAGLDEDTDALLFSQSSTDGSVGRFVREVVRIHVGAPAAQVFVLEWFRQKTAIIDYGSNQSQFLFVDRTVFAAGVRVWASSQSTDIVAGDRYQNLTMHGFQVRPSGNIINVKRRVM